jgi:hypothetical protein
MSYTTVFGGTTIYPSNVSYLSLALSASTLLEWPLESAGGTPAARIIDVTATGAYNIDLPDATQTGAGQTLLFNNLPASSSSFYVRDSAGGTLATVGVGEQWQVYLAATTTAAGTWRVFRYGASTATVQASALAGYGLTVTGSTLSQSTTVTVFTSTPRTVLDTERAAAFVWDGTGAATLNLPTAASVGNNFFVSVRNEGGGDVTVDPSGSETINSETSISLRPGDSATIITDGLEWFTLGLGQEAVFAFDYTSIDLTAETSPYTLSGAELNRIAYKFIGTLTANMEIVVPPTVQQYWVDNQTTGAYTLTVKTASGSGSSVTQGGRGIYYCDGSAVVNASTAGLSAPLLASEGGTGQTAYTIGDILYASGATTLSRLADAAVGNALVSGGVGVAPAWGKIGMATHVSGTLPLANGGTGGTDAATARTSLGLGTIATQAASAVSISGGTITGITDLAVADGGTGASTAAGARTNLGATTVGANIFTLTNPSAVTFLQMNADNTVSALDAASFRTAIGASAGTGTVTSVGGTGTVNGLTLSGTVTTSGNLTLGGTLAINNADWSGADLDVTNGGTGASSASAARSNLGAAASGANTDITALDQDVAVTATGTIAADSIGYRGLPQSSSTTLALSDAGKHVYVASNITIPANGTTAFPVGTTIALVNSGASTITVSITTDTLRQAGTANTGTRTLAAYGVATVVKVASTTWFISGNVT